MGSPLANESTPTPTTPVKNSRKEWAVVVGVAAVVALAVFVGGALVSGVMATSGRGGLFNREPGDRPNFQIAPAAELPTTQPNVRGSVVQRTDKTISVVERGGFGPGEANQSQNNNAPQIAVVVTNDTLIYHDITRMNLNEGAPGGTVQQKLEAGSLEAINPNSRITVWGDQSGQQLTAKVLVYSDPISFRQP
jgi:hypothetical protein